MPTPRRSRLRSLTWALVITVMIGGAVYSARWEPLPEVVWINMGPPEHMVREHVHSEHVIDVDVTPHFGGVNEIWFIRSGSTLELSRPVPRSLRFLGAWLLQFRAGGRTMYRADGSNTLVEPRDVFDPSGYQRYWRFRRSESQD